MSDTIDDYKAIKQRRKEDRAAFGVPCPVCVEKLPKAHPSILLPGQRCRIHGFRDQRDERIMDTNRHLAKEKS